MSPLALTVTESTGVSIGLVLTVVVTGLSCTIWIVKTMGKLTQRIERLEADHYTRSEAAEAALRMAIANPGMSVPDPRNPGQIITASSCVGTTPQQKPA